MTDQTAALDLPAEDHAVAQVDPIGWVEMMRAGPAEAPAAVVDSEGANETVAVPVKAVASALEVAKNGAGTTTRLVANEGIMVKQAGRSGSPGTTGHVVTIGSRVIVPVGSPVMTVPGMTGPVVTTAPRVTVPSGSPETTGHVVTIGPRVIVPVGSPAMTGPAETTAPRATVPSGSPETTGHAATTDPRATEEIVASGTAASPHGHAASCVPLSTTASYALVSRGLMTTHRRQASRANRMSRTLQTLSSSARFRGR